MSKSRLTKSVFTMTVGVMILFLFSNHSASADEGIVDSDDHIKFFTLDDYSSWALQFYSGGSDYSVEQNTYPYGALRNYTKDLKEDDIVADQSFELLDNYISIDAFALRGQENGNSSDCFNKFFENTNEDLWKNEAVSTDGRFSAKREFHLQYGEGDFRKTLSYDDLSLLSYKDYCLGVVVHSEEWNRQENIELITSILKSVELISEPKFTATDYVQFGELFVTDRLALDEIYERALSSLGSVDNPNTLRQRISILYKLTDLYSKHPFFPNTMRHYLQQIENLDNSSPLSQYGLALVNYFLEDYEAGEKYLRKGFVQQLQIAEFPLPDDPLFGVYKRFRSAMFDRVNMDEISMWHENWRKWFENYDFSESKRSNYWDEYHTAEKIDAPVTSPNGTSIDIDRYSNTIKYRGKYALAHDIWRNDYNGWHLIDADGRKVTPDFEEIENFTDDLIFGSLHSKKNFYRLDGSEAFSRYREEESLLYFAVGEVRWPENDVFPAVEWFGRWKHFDLSGNPLYVGYFEDLGSFFGGVAVAKRDGQYFHIDMSGKPIYEARFEFVGNYSGRFAVAKDEKGYFHIDRTGKPLYSERFAFASDYKFGIAKVQTSERLQFYIDIHGKPIADEQWMGNEEMGMIPAGNEQDGFYHINRKGKRLYPESYRAVLGFNDNGAVVVDYKDNFYVIDPKGHIIQRAQAGDEDFEFVALKSGNQPPFHSQYRWVGTFSDGTFAVIGQNGEWFHVDDKGNRLYAQNYKWADDYQNSVARVLTSDNLWQLINKKGETLGDDHYLEMSQPIDGVIKVKRLNGQWNMIAEAGRLLFSEDYVNIGDFSGGFVLVQDEQQGYFFISQSDHKLNRKAYSYATPFAEDRAGVANENGMYHINSSGKPAYNQTYMSVGSYHDGKSIVRDQQGNWSYIDLNGSIVLDEHPLQTLEIEMLQAIGPGMMPCPEIVFGFINPNDSSCGIMQKDLQNSLQR